MVKLLHTADWQLGKQFENLEAPSDKLVWFLKTSSVRTATRGTRESALKLPRWTSNQESSASTVTRRSS
jgi:DNA repair exonuclease SbcCD nuclease subunit